MDETSKLHSLDLKEAVISEGKVEGAEETYFFERHDGSVVSVREQEAWNILKGRTPIVGLRYRQPKLIGVSSGNIFQRAVIEAQALIRAGKIAEAREIMNKGQAEELEAARGNIKYPRDFDTIDRSGNPVRIQDLR